MGVLFALLLLVIILIRVPAVQNFVVGKVTGYLESRIHTPVKIGYIRLDFPKKLVLENIYFEDQTQDTLLAGEHIKVDFNLWKLLDNTLSVQEVELHGITAKIRRTLPDSAFNFDYILDALTSPEKPIDTTTVNPEDSLSTGPPMRFDIGNIKLSRIKAIYLDETMGMDLALSLGDLHTEIETFDLEGAMRFGFSDIEIAGLKGHVKQWVPENYQAAEPSEGLLPTVELGKIHLRDIDLAYLDRTGGMDTRFAIEDFEGLVESLDLNKQLVEIDYLRLNGSKSHVVFEKLQNIIANADPTTDEAQAAASGDGPETAENSMGWMVSAKEIQLNNTSFLFRDDNEKRIAKGFDYFNISIQGLETKLDDLYFRSDSISGKLEHLQARDHSGLTIKRLQGDFQYTNQGAALTNLWLETPKTVLKDELIVRYEDLATLTDRLGDMEIQADFQKSHLAMEDILYFLPDLDTMQVMQKLWPQTFHIDAKINGLVKNLNIPRLTIRTLDQTRLVAKARLQGLPDIEKLKINLDLTEFITSEANIQQLVPVSVLPDSIRIPQTLKLAGTFNGGMQGFVTDLDLTSSAGNVYLVGNYALENQGRDTTYQADLQIEDLMVGHIMQMDSTLGKVSLDVQVNGTGLDVKKMTADVSAQIVELQAMGYTYQDIEFQAEARAGQFTAQAQSQDRNIDFQLDATADMSGQYPKIQADMMIDSVNLKNLGLMNDELRYHGRVLVDLETADLDFLNGSIKIQESSIAYNKERYILNEVELSATASDTTNLLQLQSEFLQAHMTGQFNLTELNKAIRDIVAVYYQPDSVAPTYTYEPQQFDFSAKLMRSRFVREFLPDLTEMRDITLDISFNSAEKFILAKALAPQITYGGTVVDDIGLDVTTFDSTMYYSALIKKISVSEIDLINTLVSGSVVQNQLDVGLWIKDSVDRERYHIGMEMGVESGNFVMRMEEDGLMLNYDKWQVNPENLLSFGKDGLRTKDFELSLEDQMMILQSQDSTLNAPIDILFDNFRIETFSQLLESDILNIGGGINGMATISRLESNPVFVSDLTIEQFYFGDDTVGNVLLKVNNERENIFSADIYIVENGNYVNLVGDYIAVPGREPELDFKLDFRPMTMKTLEAFSLGYLRQTEGVMQGLLTVKGSPARPVINGELLFDQAGLNVSMLNANFRLDGQKIIFDNSGLRFNRFELKDSKNNIARLNGTVATQTYRDFDFNLTLNMDDFQVLNSTSRDNDMYYGQMFISSNLTIRGNMNQPKIDGNLRVEDNTNVTFVLPNDDPGMVEREGIIKFVNKKDTAQVNYFGTLDSLTTTQLAGIDLSVNIQTHEDAEFSIVIDPGSGDALNIKGEAELTAGIDLSGKINLTGTYTVSEGSYSFTFEPVKRRFGFRKGSTITWTGDPVDARLDITATYSLRAPTLELVQNQIGSEQTGLYRQRVPFDVVLGISGEMFKPQLEFSIDLNENNALISQDVASKVNTALAQLGEDESEMNKQVFALIILGRFMAANPFESVSGGGNVGTMAVNSARSSVSSLLSSQLNKIAGDLVHGVDLDFDLQSGDDYSTGRALSRTDLNVGVSKMLLDDRLKITIGSNFELEGNSRPGENTTNIAGDITIDYQLSKDGRYFLRAYRKNQYQVTLQGQFVETGLGFIINLDYDEFREIFMSTKELADLSDLDNRRIAGRFDQERLETDSVYRDSVRTVVRDSLMRNDPEFRERMRQRQQRDSTQNVNPDSTNLPNQENEKISFRMGKMRKETGDEN